MPFLAWHKSSASKLLGGLLPLALGAFVACTLATAAQAQGGNCGELANAYGPYDYRSDRDKLPIVDGAHFTPGVEALVRANTGYIGADLDYTLRAFPNHHRALVSMMRYGEKLKLPKVPAAHYSVECYFQRAIRFRADDTTVRMLYATFLGKNSRIPEALQQLEVAAAGDNPFTHYNLGLVYLELNSPEKALLQAHRAAELGFPRTELKERLIKAGKWAEPVAPAASASAPAAPAPPAAPAAAAASAPPAAASQPQ